jgi:hypothetical protein
MAALDDLMRLIMTRSQDSTVTNQIETEKTAQQHTIGEGTAQEKSGGPTESGNPSGHRGTTPGAAEGKEADIDEALKQQGKTKPR